MSTVRKAVTAVFVALAGGVGTAMADGNLTQAEVIVAAGAALVAGAGVYAVPNASDA